MRSSRAVLCCAVGGLLALLFVSPLKAQPEKADRKPVYWEGTITGWYHQPPESMRGVAGLVMSKPNQLIRYSLNLKFREEPTTTSRIELVLESGSWKCSVSDRYYLDPDGNRHGAGAGGSGGGQIAANSVRRASVSYGSHQKKPGVVLSFSIDVGGESFKFPIEVKDLDLRGLKVVVSKAKQSFSQFPGVRGKVGGTFDPQVTTFLRRRQKTKYSEETWYFVRNPSPVELEMTLCPKDWVPTLDNKVAFTARVVYPPGIPVKWEFALHAKNSRLPGVCNNAYLPRQRAKKWNNEIEIDSYDLFFDFRHYDGTDSLFEKVEGPWRILRTKKATAESVEFSVSCLDYGAYGKLRARAYVGGRWVTAKVKNTGEEWARIPRDDSAPAKGPYIAPAAKADDTGTSYAGLDPKADDDSEPAGRTDCQGDGLSVFEEYRGFVAHGFSEEAKEKPIFQRLDPTWKDLFVRIDRKDRELLAPFVFNFQTASGLHVHTVTPHSAQQPYIGSDRRINFLSRPEHRVVWQHALYLVSGRLSGIRLGTSFGGIGPPVHAKKTVIDVGRIIDLMMQLELTMADPSSINTFLLVPFTVVHELGHGVGLQHHGRNKFKGKVVTVNGRRYRWVTVEGGPNSGNAECAMRSLLARYYLNSTTGSTPQPYDKSRETLGLRFCIDGKGTGINDKSMPNWHCGDASAQRGNCKGQIVVNDRCSQSAGGSGSAPELSGDPGSAADDEQQSEDAEVAQSQARAGVFLDLRVDGEKGRRIVPGEAVVVRLQLRGMPAGERGWGTEPDEPAPAGITRIGSKRAPWLEQVRFVTRSPEGKWVPAPVKIQPVGLVRQVTVVPRTPQAPTHFKVSQYTEPVLDLSAAATYIATFALVPAATGKLPAGTLRIFASMPTGAEATAKGEEDRVLSGLLVLEVIDPKDLPAEEQETVGSRRTLSRANLAFAAGRYPEAELLARAVVAELADSLEARLLLARSLERQEKLKAAYHEYQRALNSVKPTDGPIDEPPETILFDLYRLEERLGIEPQPLEVAEAGLGNDERSGIVEHSLWAESSTGEQTERPFAADSKRFVFTWKLSEAAASEPIEARWIAADTDGVTPPDYLIASSKSDPGKHTGQFTLSSPNKGFPPGSYRLELWQSGKRLHIERFEVVDWKHVVMDGGRTPLCGPCPQGGSTMRFKSSFAAPAVVAISLCLIGGTTPALAFADLGDQLSKLLPNDGAADDYFGWSAAISGATAIVGVWRDDDNGVDSGSAYLFDTTTGTQIAKLLPNEGAAGDAFGYAVAINGTTAIVGAGWNDESDIDSGSAYLFDTTNGKQIAKLLPDDGAPLDRFGNSVAIWGTTAIVGASYHNDKGDSSGSAYLFDTTTGQQLAKLLPDDGKAHDGFGYSVAISGTTAIVGARSHKYYWWNEGFDSGSAYLFDISDPANPRQIAKLLPDDGARNDPVRFGWSVAISSDGIGTTAIVGASYDDDNGAHSGSAYLFDIADPANPRQIAKLLPDDGAEGDRFGHSVAISGSTAIVGEHFHGDNGAVSGAAYLFDATNGEQIAKLRPDDNTFGHYFGFSVGISGAKVVVTAYLDDDNGKNSGSVYLFDAAKRSIPEVQATSDMPPQKP